MEKTKILLKIMVNMPKRCVYGNSGDFARYRYLVGLTDVLSGKESFLNKYFRDQNSIWVYPAELGSGIYIYDGSGLHPIEKIEETASVSYGTICLPGKAKDKILTVFPADEDGMSDSMITEALFVESFPYGKHDFVDMVFRKNQELPFQVVKKVLFWDDGIKFGATDISDRQNVFEEAADIFRKYVPRIEILKNCVEEDDLRLDLKKQLQSKKKSITQKRMEDFGEGFESEYIILKERYLCSEDRDRKGVISHITYEEVSDYKRVKNTDNVEKKILDNFLSNVEKHKEDLITMLNYLYFPYLAEIDVFSKDYFENRVGSLINEIRKSYQFGKKERCPDAPLEYRRLCGQEQYVIKLKRHVDDVMEEQWKKETYEDIKNRLRKCEEKYNEAYQI